MRWHILRTLLHKELLRHVADRGGIFMALLLVAAALVLSFFGKSDAQAAGLTGGLQKCYIDYGVNDSWIDHLHAHVPERFREQIEFRSDFANPHGDRRIARDSDNVIVYRPGQAGIQINPEGGPRDHYDVVFWHPSEDGGELTPVEAWFWQEWTRYSQGRATARLAGQSEQREAEVRAAFPTVKATHERIRGGIDSRSALAMGLVLFAVFVPCVYLLPSLTCEEHERGILLAQALSPASPLEILAAKFFFYPLAGIGLAALVAGIYNPPVLRRPFFWLALTVTALGALGIGMTIASLARTQRKASLGALCYMMAVALWLTLCQVTRLPLSGLALEYHSPRMLHAVLENTITDNASVGIYWVNLAGATVLAVMWLAAATVLFRQRGWQ